MISMFDAVKPVSIVDIEAARERLQSLGLLSPLVVCDAAHVLGITRNEYADLSSGICVLSSQAPLA